MVNQEITEEGIQVESLGRTKWNCKVLGVDGWRYPLSKKSGQVCLSGVYKSVLV